MNRWTRRDWLGSCAAAGGAWAIPSGLPLLSAARLRRKVLVIFLDGGLSHLDTFDGKPEAPADIRGDVPVSPVPGSEAVLSTDLPRLRERMNRVALVRSMSHGEGNHDRGAHFLLTGVRPSPVLAYPALGACLADDAASAGPLPPYVAIPSAHAHAGAGFLGAERSPFAVGGDPGRPGFEVRHLGGGAVADPALSLVDRLDALDGAPLSPDERSRDGQRARARAMREQEEVRAAFDLGREPAKRRGHYGRHRLGQSCLLGLRLLDHGVRTVFVRNTGWDHHVAIHRALTTGFPPPLRALDEALSALLDDLRERDDITVLLASEFGRTPRLNPRGGRDHWPRAQSVLLFGGGVKGGVVHGATDARGEEPAADPVSPQDLWATMIALAGAEPARVFETPDGRPVRLVAEGARVLSEVAAP